MNADIIFDFTNLTDTAVGEHGIPDSRIDLLAEKAKNIHLDIKNRRDAGKLPFMDLPYADVDDIITFADTAKKRFDSFVNVGIGGSALGAQALVKALCHPFHNNLDRGKRDGMKMFFADNIDPDYLKGMFDVLDPATTLFNIITKSGSTAETMGTFLLAKSFLEESLGNKWNEHVVFTTDVEKGDLRAIADEKNITSFVVPDGVGGRFSVLCPVGLLPAACAGIDIRMLLSGAAAMDKRLQSTDVMDNPAYLYALYQYLMDVDDGKNVTVMMPYSSGLYGLADWFRQLWAESLGKKHALDGSIVNVGTTPVKALGVTDQHSQVQLYVEGPYDKVFTILAVQNFEHELQMKPSFEEKSSLGYLGERTIAELMRDERLGTTYALTDNNRPNLTIEFPETSPHSVGQFMHALEVATVFAGGLYGIDPLDQPGVEGGKIAAFALMGRAGYEDKADQIKKGLSSNDRYRK